MVLLDEPSHVFELRLPTRRADNHGHTGAGTRFNVFRDRISDRKIDGDFTPAQRTGEIPDAALGAIKIQCQRDLMALVNGQGWQPRRRPRS